MNYCLIKSEADCYSIDDLKKDKNTAWTGVRNYQARNFMQSMAVGDGVLFYHSNGTKEYPTGVYGIAKVVKIAHPDETQFEKGGEYFEPRATHEKPVWYCVDVGFVEKFKNLVSLTEIKLDPKLAGIMVAQTGSRLSVQPVSEKHFARIVALGQ
jgi:predicted RNA-binding protein with PUA-like domain